MVIEKPLLSAQYIRYHNWYMLMASRLIEDFKKQTKDTILDYMDRLRCTDLG